MYGFCPECGSENLLKLPGPGHAHRYTCRDCRNTFRIRNDKQNVEKAWPDNRYRVRGPKIEDYADDLTYRELDGAIRARWGKEPEVEDALDHYVNGLYPNRRYRFRTIPVEITRTRNRRSHI